MPHTTDKSDANKMPDPELDPLQNPLLAAHMGRWAEVYFANPPEKRGQAISALLGELGNISAAKSPSMQALNNDYRSRDPGTTEEPDSFPAAEESVYSCSACAYSNSAGHTFCGMCGAPLQVLREANVTPVPAADPIAGGSWSHPKPSRSGQPDELESEAVPYRQRVSMGIALAILLAMLGYMTWRGAKALSSAPSTESAPSHSLGRAVTATSAQQPSAMRQDQTTDVRPSSPMIGSVPAGSFPATTGERGAVELATAEKYLNGSQGTPRDSAEAAQWLWKAVGKGNLPATMALSDLYLRGDGVSKSCDQARLLLEAAARKGEPTATERLRNLQASGCD